MSRRYLSAGKGCLPNGPDPPPSLKGLALIDAKEWDVEQKLMIVICAPGACQARVGTDFLVHFY